MTISRLHMNLVNDLQYSYSPTKFHRTSTCHKDFALTYLSFVTKAGRDMTQHIVHIN